MKINKNYNFSYETKKEICNYYIENKEYTIYLISAFLNNISEIILDGKEHGYEFVTTYIDVIKLFKSFFIEDKIEVHISNQKTLKYHSSKYKVILLLKDTKIVKDLSTIYSEIKDKKCEETEEDFERIMGIKSAIMAGFFLSSASVSNPLSSSNYHLEFRVQDETIISLICGILDDLEIHYSRTTHHNKQIIYIKKIQDISDVLKLMNAPNNMFILEDHRITRDFANSCQRLTNLDVSNASKSVKALSELKEVISGVKKTREYYELNDNIKMYCDVVLNSISVSMSELVEILNEKFKKKVTKSWINHTNIKLRQIYKKYNK